jgi:YidC/Oxa1 family membrane protein insertase
VVAIAIFQALLNSIGWVLAEIYDVIGNYGLSIIVLTIIIRVVLLPLGIKQIKSMGAMQSIQPKIKEIQKKYKGNKQKAQEETMKLYKEAGVNPLGGCLPLLLQFPILIAMYAVIRAPVPNAAYDPANPNPNVPEFVNNHLPVDSQLYHDVTTDTNMDFLGMDLLCSASQAGKQVDVPNSEGEPSGLIYDCGTSNVDKIPYFALLVVMIGTTFFQQRQMQRASPPGAASSQQQAIMKIMPIMFGIFGYAFPAGLTLYWTVSNFWQIGQQYALLKAGHIGPEAMERRMAEQRAKNASGTPAKKGLMARMQERAEEARRQQDGRRPTSGGGKPGGGKPSGGKPSGGSSSRGPQPKQRRPNTGGSKGGGSGGSTPKRRPGGGTSDGKGDGEAGP